MIKKVQMQIGLGQARRICQMSATNRLAFIAEGLPIIHASAKGFWFASAQLRENPREAAVLAGFAQEEAAKILILLDVVRCPEKRIADRISKLVNWFYKHHQRLIYAQLAEWWFDDLAALQEAVKPLRKDHDLEGNMGEFIVPNSTLYRRESKLYADVEAYEDGTPVWHAPTVWHAPIVPASDFASRMPTIVQVVDAMAACGIFTLEGLAITSEVWGQLEFQDKETLRDAERLTQQLLGR
jgi:AbiV family abortive infection protein